MGKYFGTDGFRGEANKVLMPRHAYLIGRYLGSVKNADGVCRAVIGRDTRLSGTMLEAALTAGLTAGGAEVSLLGVTTTPSVSWLVREEGYDFGIMISASHNPYYDNGIKLINSRGEKMEEEFLLRIEDYMDSGSDDLPFAGRDAIGCAVGAEALLKKYAAFLEGLSSVSFAGRKVALDTANGSAYELAEKVFRALGAEPIVIHHAPDGVNINTNCGSTHMESLMETVVREKCFAGFAFDGDADRCLAVDETGRAIDGDRILYICGKHMKKNGTLANNKVVTTVMSNFGLYKAFDREGIGYEKTKVGDKYVYENMQKTGNCLGGEQSGHIIFSAFETTGDGIATAVKLMETLILEARPFSELASEVQVYPQLLKNVRVTDKKAAEENAAVLAAVEEAEKKLGGDGRILLRASGTEPLIRVMAEAATDRLCEECVDFIIDVMKQEKLTLTD